MFDSGTLIFVVLLGLVILLPIASIGYVSWRLWKKGGAWAFAGIAICVGFSYSVYDAIYPSDSFYKDEFKRVSGMSFPESGVVTQKYSTYPDIHGDYASCALIELSTEDYNLLKKRLMSNANQKKTFHSTICGPVAVKGKQAAIEITTQDGKNGEYSNWGVMEGTPMAYFEFWSS